MRRAIPFYPGASRGKPIERARPKHAEASRPDQGATSSCSRPQHTARGHYRVAMLFPAPSGGPGLSGSFESVWEARGRNDQAEHKYLPDLVQRMGRRLTAPGPVCRVAPSTRPTEESSAMTPAG